MPAGDGISRLSEPGSHLFVCPICSANLSPLDEGMECESCRTAFGSDNGVPLLFCPNEWDGKSDVQDVVKAFYEEYPFPDYEDIDSAYRLRQMAERGLFAKLLDEQIPYGSTVLEVGCGTGQLSNYLAMRHGRTVFGTDLCVNSLRLADGFKQQQGIENVYFSQMNLFRPAFRRESFDFLICNGVLHHTSDPYLGFETILGMVKPGGFVIIGLYNRFGRIPTQLKGLLFKYTGDHLTALDRRMRDRQASTRRSRAWFMDQFKHPHESTHTLGEVQGWFSKCGVDFLNSIPKATPGGSFSDQESLFEANPRGTWFDHLAVQIGMLASGGKEGGFFLTIGRKSHKGRQG